MNQLPIEKRTQIIKLLVEGNSMRATSRVVGVSINTVVKLLIEVGTACQMFHDEKVINLKKTKRIQADEIWSFIYSKKKNIPDGMEDRAGDIWTWTGLDPESKLMVTWLVGERSSEAAKVFLTDIKNRVLNRIQLTTDSFGAYKNAVIEVFGRPNLDYAQLHKSYESTQTEARYSPAICVGINIIPVAGKPKLTYISTSHVERQNLTMRMHMRRFTRLTNAFSKKIENHCHAIALHFVYYNFCKVHSSIDMTPAMKAGVFYRKMEVEEIVKLTDKYFIKRSN